MTGGAVKRHRSAGWSLLCMSPNLALGGVGLQGSGRYLPDRSTADWRILPCRIVWKLLR